MLELILALAIGITAGTLTGLTPGIHINLIAATLLTFALFSEISLGTSLVFITSMAITHTFLDFIPSIFLGAPDEDTGLSALPGHEFLIKGHGHHALLMTLTGSTIAVASLALIIPLFIFLIPKVYPFLQQMMAFFLIWTSIFLLHGEKNSKLNSFIIFLLAGFLGIATLNLNIGQPLLPLLTGLFGSSTLIFSIKTKTKVPKQTLEKIPISRKELISPGLITLFVSPICALLPGLGSSQAAVIGSSINRNLNKEQFLILLGSVNTLVMSTSFLTLFLISKTRTGAANAISQLTNITPQDIILIIVTIFITAIISIPLTINISKLFAKNIHKFNYTVISSAILILLTILIISISGLIGLAVFIVATALGLACIELGARRGFLMGCLLIPTIILYLPFG